MSFDRVYRLPRHRTEWLLRGFLTFVGAVLVLGVATNQGGAFGFVVAGICLVWLCVAGVRSERSWPSVGIRESADGLEVIGLGVSGGLRTQQRYVWARIDHFEPPKHRAKGSVWVVVANGHRIRLMGTKQGIKMSWQDGETHDIAGALNERLADWRTSRLSSLTHP